MAFDPSTASPILPPSGLPSGEAYGGFLAADEEMLREFTTESGEHLAKIEEHLLVLEKDSRDLESLNAVFRAFHTIKGLAGFLELPSIQTLAHEIESLLDLARSSRLDVTSEVIDVVLESTDVLRNELRNIELALQGQEVKPADDLTLLLRRIRLIDPACRRTASQSPPESAPVEPLLAQVQSVALRSRQSGSGPPEPNPKTNATDQSKNSSSIRIDTGKLDQLMDLVGELVIAHTQVAHSLASMTQKNAGLLHDLNQVFRITAGVQRITTGMRMVPIGQQFQKSARLVRDLSRRAGKDVVFETAGEETELDKAISEELADPILHMVRNSIDHGIESAEDRAASGKDRVARIRLSAYHRSGQIVIEISDDGRGLDRDKILHKALERGLIRPGTQLKDSQVFQLIFEAGFSTAESVTDISGRGVGMDVVRKHVQRLRGRIEIESKSGVGTTFRIKLPLTLAIIDGLKVAVGSERYIVPLFCVKEMLRPTKSMLVAGETVGEMAIIRGVLLPVVRLYRRFAVQPRTTQLTDGVLVVIGSDGKQYCLFVDDLEGKQEVVIKGLGASFKHVEGVAGCAILGDGRVGLILDVDELCKGMLDPQSDTTSESTLSPLSGS